MTLKKILAQRAKTHGDFADHAEMVQLLKGDMKSSPAWKNGLSDMQREALEMIAHKIGRILSGNPNHQDHWDDIAGYATIVANRLPRQK